MRLWLAGSSQSSCHNQTDPLPRGGSSRCARRVSRPVRIMTGARWEGFINALEPDQRQTFMTQVYKIVHHYCWGKA
jgi:hypothetical protein